MTSKKPLLLLIPAAAVVGITISVAIGREVPILNTDATTQYLVLIGLNGNDLHDGNCHTANGTTLHFNEEGVEEGSPLRIAPRGSIHLTTPISGIISVEIDPVDTTGTVTYSFAWCSAPYEAIETITGGGYAGYTNAFHANETKYPPRYFSIINHDTDRWLEINSFAIRYTCSSDYDTIHSNKLLPDTDTYDYPYGSLDWNATGADIEIDKFDRSLGNYDNDHKIPGSYPVAYTVTSASGNHSFQFSTMESYSIVGADSGKHVVTFHSSYNHEAERDTYEVAHGADYLGSFPRGLIWDNPLNDFENVTEDRHYYPTMNAFGFDPNGHCSPVSASWYINEAHVEMPKPDHVDEGYRFVGWFKDQGLTQPYDPGTPICWNLVLYAKVVKESNPIRPIHYYDIDRMLTRIDYAVLDQPNGQSHKGTYTIDCDYDDEDVFYYGATKDHGYGTEGTVITVEELEGPVVIRSLRDPEAFKADYRYSYLTSTEYEGEMTFYKMNYLNDLNGFREKMDWTYLVRLPALPFHIKENDGYKTMSLAGKYLYPYDRRNTYLDDLDALTELGSYAYACYSANSTKPLYGIRGHERVITVGRRAFFNRFGMADYATYFPPNAKTFETEAYAGVFFNNNILILPNTLERIGPRCFMGSKNIRSVYLPLSLKSVGAHAFEDGVFDEAANEYSSFSNRNIDFFYQGTEAQFNELPEATRLAITSNARKIVYGVTMHMPRMNDYDSLLDCPFTHSENDHPIDD